MIDLPALFRRQTAWQQARRFLSWSEKIRMAEALRESVLQLRRAGHGTAPPAPSSEPGRPKAN
jgi:hypothetical protein